MVTAPLISRSKQGESYAELVPALFTIFIVFFFPLINFGTLALRYGLLTFVCRETTNACATAHSFTTGSANRPSSQAIALPTAQETAGRFSGVVIRDVQVKIIIVDRLTQSVTVTNSKLTAPANTQSKSYFIETVTTASLDPLNQYNLPVFLNVPGLTCPWQTTVSMRQVAESPEGLNE